ncbi:hypothetical protein BSAF29S_01158 [Bacillus safensis subsp. safensis]
MGDGKSIMKQLLLGGMGGQRIMNVQAMKQGAIVGSFLGFLGFPMLTIGVLFYRFISIKYE